jgi:rSAM/selenodomain-associated transferase 1
LTPAAIKRRDGGMIGAHRILDPALPQQVAAGLCALAVMTKAPRAGKVKTRLTPPLTPEEAAALNICFLRDTASAICKATRAAPATGVAVYTPVGAEDAYRGILPNAFSLLPQRGQTFGQRLIFAAEDLLRLGFESVCLIDSDSPTVPPDAFSEAAENLTRPGDRIVIGPSDDGGYYLIGLKRLHRRIFEEIDWSTERVLEQTTERAAEIGLNVHFLPTWFDVDDREALQRLCQEMFEARRSDSTDCAATSTREYLAEIMKREGRDRIWPDE